MEIKMTKDAKTSAGDKRSGEKVELTEKEASKLIKDEKAERVLPQPTERAKGLSFPVRHGKIGPVVTR